MRIVARFASQIEHMRNREEIRFNRTNLITFIKHLTQFQCLVV